MSHAPSFLRINRDTRAQLFYWTTMTMDIDQLHILAARMRRRFELYAASTTDMMFEGFPRGTPVSELIRRYLSEVCGLSAQYVEAWRSDGRSNAWIVVDDILVDITADQFGQAPVIVARESRNLRVDREVISRTVRVLRAQGQRTNS